MLILFGLILYYGLNIVSLKLLLILIFILITTPTAAHALAKSALHGNLKPILKDD
jgi:multicomponent Na+:H+ antiporter subunit G